MIPADLPPEVREILGWWLPRAARELSGKATSFSLFGGIVGLKVAQGQAQEAGDDLGIERVAGASGQAVEPLLLPVGHAATDEGGLSPFDRLTLSGHGRLVAGEPVPVAPPSPSSLCRQLRDDLASLYRPRLDRPIWLAGMIQWMARSLVFWRDGETVGKTAALEHEIAAGSPYSGAFRLALLLRCEEGSRACRDRHEEIRERFEAVAGPVGVRLRELAG